MKFFKNFFGGKGCNLILTKKGFGIQFGQFFTNSYGHPASNKNEWDY
jgi:hypothetical protein